MEVNLTYVPIDNQRKAHNATEKHILYGGAVAGGKALALTTPILTSKGWSTMGELSVGDTVFDEQGQSCKVLKRTGIMYDHKCFAICFDNGEKIIADAEHLWETENYREREKNFRRSDGYRQKSRLRKKKIGTGKRPDLALRNSTRQYEYKKPDCKGVRTTEEIRKTLKCKHNTNHAIPVTSSLVYPEQNLYIFPYLLGVWLGDGTSRSGNITIADKEIIQNIESLGCQAVKNKAQYLYNIVGLKTLLRKSGMLHNKHIPKQYLESSFEQRLELLQGLIDTDGSVKASGGTQFYNTNKNLINGVYALVTSLGIKCFLTEKRAKLYGKDCGLTYTITFTTKLPICKLTRKKERLKTTISKINKYHYIKDVYEVPSVPVRCIEVDSPSNLFLCGKSLIPTHNSCWLINDALYQCLAWAGTRVGIFRWEYASFKKTTYKTLKEWVLDVPGLVIYHNQQEHYITLCNGSEIVYGGLKPASSVAGDPFSVIKSLELASVYIDEVTDVPEDVYKFLATRVGRVKARNVRTNKIENPPSRVAASCNPHLGWVKQRFIDENHPNHVFFPSCVDDNIHLPPSYKQELIEAWDGEKDWIDRYLKGDWGAVIDYEAVCPADKLLYATTNEMLRGEPIIFGIDIGAWGNDKSIIIMRSGMKGELIHESKQQSTAVTKRQIIMLYERYNPEIMNIDSIGVGQGVFDDLADEGYPVQPVIGGESPNDERYFNRRTEIYWGLRKLLEKKLIQLPNVSTLINELGVIKYMQTASDRHIQVESKKFIKKRLGHSPDYADAVVYAFMDAGDAFLTSALINES